MHTEFLPAALAEAGLEITFQVRPSVGHGQLSPAGEVETFVHTSPTKFGGGGSGICPSPPPNLAGEVDTFIYLAGEVVTFVNMVLDTRLVMEH